VVTATRRQAREIAEAFARHCLQNGKRVWRSPQAWAFDAWLRRCHEAIWLGGNGSERSLLNPAQELALWERCIRETAQPEVSAQRQYGLARVAMQSWQLAANWGISPGALAAGASASVRTFSDWARQFQQHCRDHGWIDSAHLADEIIAALARGHISPPPDLALVGFEKLSPQQHGLLQRFEAAGSDIVTPPEVSSASYCQRIAFPGPGAELEAAAEWARRILEEDPQKRVGIVVSDLATRRSEVERIFADILTPGAVLPGAATDGGVFHLSLGQESDTCPLIAQALLILRIACHGVDYREAGRLLRSPYLHGMPAQAGKRAAIDLQIRRRGWRTVDIRKLAWLAGHAGDSLAASLEALPQTAGSRLPSEWVTVFTDQLRAFGWPGERIANSAEFQLHEHWRERLAEFASLDPVVGSLGVLRALSQLTRILQNNVFQTRDPGAPVEIMGSLEAAGLRFDHLWVTGLHDEAWPAPPRPDPLLPLALQRQLDMPSSTVHSQLRHAHWLLSCYQAGADDVVLSWPARLEDRDMCPSLLITDIAETQAADHSGCGSYRRQQTLECDALETAAWDNPPPLRAAQIHGGGSGMLTDQAQCPFRAFALHRLKATTPELPALGIDPRTRGMVLHRAMELLWGELGGSDGLARTGEAELQRLTCESVAAALATTREQTDDAAILRHIRIEARRLENLIGQILDVERQRGPFAVTQMESRETMRVGELEITIKLDRVDRLGDGRLAVLDFKTGAAKTGDWCGQRIRDAQMPLYAISRAAAPAAVAVISVKSGEVGYKGVGVEKDVLGTGPAVKVSQPDTRYFNGWDDLMQAWRSQLHTLALNFKGGAAPVTPDREACRYCDLETLCRINELHSQDHNP